MDEINDQLQSIVNIETNSQHDKLLYTLYNDLLMEIENIDSSINDINKISEIEESPSLNQSTSNKLVKPKKIEGRAIKDNTKIKMTDPQEPKRENIANTIIINTSKDQIASPTQRKSFPLNLEKIAIPKTDSLDIKLNPSITSSQSRVTSSIITVSSTTADKPITTIKKPQPILSSTEINCSNIISKPKQGVKITSSKDSSKIVLLPHKGKNYIVQNPSNPLPTSNTECNNTVEQKKQIIVTQLNDTKKISKFITRMQKLPDGKYKMLAPDGDLPTGIENLFNPNSHFIKQKVDSDSSENEQKVSYFVQSPSMNSNSNETNNVENDSQVSSEETDSMKTSSVNSNNEKTNHSETKLQNSSEETECMETSSINCIVKKTKNIQKVPQVSSQESTMSSVNYCVANKYIQKQLPITSEQMKHIGTPFVDPDTLIRIKKETPVIEETHDYSMKTFSDNSTTKKTYNVHKKSQETNSMEISSINCTIENTKNIKKVPLVSSQESTTSSVNYCVANKYIQKQLPITSEQMKHIGTPFVDPDTLIRIKKETPVIEETHDYSMKTFSDNSTTKKTYNVHKKSQETNSMEISSINCTIENTKNIKKVPLVSSQESTTSSVNYCVANKYIQKQLPITSEQMKHIGTPFVDPDTLIRIKKETPVIEETHDYSMKTFSDNSTTKKTYNVQKKSQETNSMEISSINCTIENTKNIQKVPQVSSQESTMSSVNYCVANKYIQKQLPITSEQMKHIGTPFVDPDTLIRIKKETPVIEETHDYSMKTFSDNSTTKKTYNVQKKSQETNSMEISSINCTIDNTKNIKKVPLVSSQESTTSSVNYCVANKYIQKQLPITSEQMKHIGTPFVDPDTLIRIKKETPVIEETHDYSMKTFSDNSTTEKTYNVQKKSQETNSMEISLINCTIENTKNIKKVPLVSSQESTTSSAQTSFEKTHDMETPLINNIKEEFDQDGYDSEELYEETSCMETQSVNNTEEEIYQGGYDSEESCEDINFMETPLVNNIKEKIDQGGYDSEESYEEISCMETPLVNNIKAEIDLDEYDLEELCEETSYMETSSVNSIEEEIDQNEYDLKESYEETSHIETSSVNSINETSDINEEEPQELSQETNNIDLSNVNSFIDKTNHFQKQLPITPKQIKCIGTPLVDPNILIRFKKETPTFKNNSSNTMFKAPDTISFQRHKFIVSRNTTSKKYEMKNVNDLNNKINLKTIGNQELFASPRPFLRLIPKTQHTIQTNNQPLIISKYDSNSYPEAKLNPNFNCHGKKVLVKILKPDVETPRIIPVEEIKKFFPRVIHASKITKVEENPLKNKISPSEVTQKEKRMKVSHNEESRNLIACKNKYCTSLTHDKVRPELIDNLYCSLACKMLDSKQTVNKSDVQLKEDLSKKPVIDRKKLLEKLKNRINKRKQLLPSSNPEKSTRNIYHDEPKEIKVSCTKEIESPCTKKIKVPRTKEIEVPSTKPSINIQSIDQQSSLNSSYQIIPKSVEDLGDLRIDIQPKTIDVKEMNDTTSKYIKKNKFISAPKKLFDTPFPCNTNNFIEGHKLEGIDPTHESLFCVLTVVGICGYRIKLHFDGYPAHYDYWVNADNPDLFHINWCVQNNRPLEFPRGYKNKFDWYDYLKENGGAIPAPKINFVSTKNLSVVSSHKFTIGTKLEALDKMTRTLSKQLICVATVADVLGNRIRIHFDGWSNDFDYWADITSTNLHPIGWCDKNGRNLCPPNGYDDLKGKKPFKWTEYLKKTKSKPVPEDAFVRRPLREFTCNMAIEVVDLVVPSLIRIAKVVDVKGNELKILYDRFDSKYAYWIDDDSSDIHPIGWCSKTNHPLEIPSNEMLNCNIKGCNGKGNANNLKPLHFVSKDCPYDFDKWSKIVNGLPTLPDRITLKDLPIKKKRPRKNLYLDEKKKEVPKVSKTASKQVFEPKKKLILKQKEKIIQKQKQGVIQIPKQGINQNKPNKIDIRKNVKKRRQIKSSMERIMKVMGDIERNAGRPVEKILYNPHYEIKGKVWPDYPILELPKRPKRDPKKWSTQDVGSFVDKLVSLNSTYRSPDDEVKYAGRFIKRKIDGKLFLNLTQEYISKSMKIPLGTTLKIINGIIKLRREIPDLVFKDEKL